MLVGIGYFLIASVIVVILIVGLMFFLYGIVSMLDRKPLGITDMIFGGILIYISLRFLFDVRILL